MKIWSRVLSVPVGAAVRSGVSHRPRLSLVSIESFNSYVRISHAKSNGALPHISCVSFEDGVIGECRDCCRSAVFFIAVIIEDSSTPEGSICREVGRARESDMQKSKRRQQDRGQTQGMKHFGRTEKESKIMLKKSGHHSHTWGRISQTMGSRSSPAE